VTTSTTQVATTSSLISTPKPKVDIIWWIQQILGETFDTLLFENYGCTGRGFFNPHEKNAGQPVDAVDKAINKWKKCSQCSMDVLFSENSGTIMYECPVDQTCGSSGIEKAICECDKQFAETLKTIKERNNGELKLLNTNLPAENCATSEGGISGELFCCQKITGSFSMYNDAKFCCEDSTLHSIGSCANDEGIKFNKN
jgi:hypothetical protein